jgi:hypothetical protein
MSRQQTDLSMDLHGTESFMRNGALHTLSTNDHPVARLLQTPVKLIGGMGSSVGLTKHEVLYEEIELWNDSERHVFQEFRRPRFSLI